MKKILGLLVTTIIILTGCTTTEEHTVSYVQEHEKYPSNVPSKTTSTIHLNNGDNQLDPGTYQITDTLYSGGTCKTYVVGQGEYPSETNQVHARDTFTVAEGDKVVVVPGERCENGGDLTVNYTTPTTYDEVRYTNIIVDEIQNETCYKGPFSNVNDFSNLTEIPCEEIDSDTLEEFRMCVDTPNSECNQTVRVDDQKEYIDTDKNGEVTCYKNSTANEPVDCNELYSFKIKNNM
jgi:hypothetical protein